VVFFHGFTGDRMESHWIFVKCARALASRGIASLRFDFYGSGESEGEFRQVTLSGEIEDARMSVEFFRRRKDVDPKRLGLVGFSLGGTVAASIAARVKARALVLWAALAHPHELRALAERATLPLPRARGAREYNAHEVSANFLTGVDKIDPLEALTRFRGSTLIIHPEKDEYLSLQQSEDLLRKAGAAMKQ
jgi:dienelactone hydrolase